VNCSKRSNGALASVSVRTSRNLPGPGKSGMRPAHSGAGGGESTGPFDESPQRVVKGFLSAKMPDCHLALAFSRSLRPTLFFRASFLQLSDPSRRGSPHWTRPTSLWTSYGSCEQRLRSILPFSPEGRIPRAMLFWESVPDVPKQSFICVTRRDRWERLRSSCLNRAERS